MKPGWRSCCSTRVVHEALRRGLAALVASQLDAAARLRAAGVIGRLMSSVPRPTQACVRVALAKLEDLCHSSAGRHLAREKRRELGAAAEGREEEK